MMRGMRGAMLDAKSVPTARDYVQDGLVAMWDGIENAGWGVHDAEATVWRNLVGNGHDGTFLGTPTWYANALHSKTQDGWCNVGKVLSGLTDITIEAVVSGWTTAVYRWAFNDVTCRDSYGVQRYDVATTVVFKAAGTRTYKSNLIAVTNTVALGVYASSMGLATGYANSEQVASFSFDPTKIEENTSKDYAIGKGNDYGDYHSVRIYGKVLTAAEIAHNYAVDKERFNLS